MITVIKDILTTLLTRKRERLFLERRMSSVEDLSGRRGDDFEEQSRSQQIIIAML